jgi:Bacterial Ig-like domain (group 3)
MRLNRPPGVASNPEPAGGRRAGAGVVRVLSVTGAAVALCAMGALPAMASSAHTTRYATKTVVSVPKTGYTHTDIKLSATEDGSGGNPTGTVTFWIGTRKLCHGSLYRRKTSCEAVFSDPATKTIVAKYSGNAHHKASSGTAVIKITNKPTTTPPPPPPPGAVATTTTITNPASNVYSYVNAGQSYTVTATVASNTGDSVPTGTVSFTLTQYPGTPPPAFECLNVTLVDGNASCTVTTAVPDYGFVLYEAAYTPTAGSDWTTSNSLGSGDHKVVTWDITSTLLTFNPSPATEGSAVTLTADVTDQGLDGLYSAYGGPDLVNFTANGVAIPGCTGVAVTDPTDGPDNIATCPYTAPTTAGPVTIVATYLGDDYALKSTDTETLTVNP